MSVESCTVSVITATRNRPALLAEALRSIAAQTYPSFEALVIDDGSDPAHLRRYEEIWAGLDGRFVLHTRSKPSDKGGSPAASRNRGIKLATGGGDRIVPTEAFVKRIPGTRGSLPF